MDSKAKTYEYAQKIKSILIDMAINDELPMDMTTLDTTKFEEVLEPVFNQLESIETDAIMALDGDWDCSSDEGKDGFNCQIEHINAL